MAKAIVLREHGNSNVLKLEDIEIKKPKENELLIRQTAIGVHFHDICLLYTSPSPRDISGSRMPSSA